VALLREGRLRALAVGSPQRVALLPEVPTLAELGFPAANLGSLFGLFAPGRTPAPRLQALNRAVNAVLDEPGFRERLHAGGQLPAGGTREDFAARIAAEAAARRGAAARR
jgi:tripartite-type tricarboxylate transporter receptor subunit TctC